MRRREFSGLAAAGAVAATLAPNRFLLSGCLAAAQPRGFDGFQFVELAIATICTDGFGNHGHRPAFDSIPSFGFKNVEFNLWYPDTITPQYIESIGKRCEQTGLKPISLQGTGFGGAARDGLIKDVSHKLLLMQYCQQLDCHIVKFTGSQRGSNGGLKTVIDVCRELKDAAEELGVLVALENHAGNVLERIADYEEVFSAIDSPNIGLCLDTGHFEGAGIDLHEVLDKFASRTLHVDLKDCRAKGQGHDTVPFKQGVTDFDSFLSHLMETNYRGYLVIEQAWNEPRGDWQADLKDAHKMFQKWERNYA